MCSDESNGTVQPKQHKATHVSGTVSVYVSGDSEWQTAMTDAMGMVHW